MGCKTTQVFLNSVAVVLGSKNSTTSRSVLQKHKTTQVSLSSFTTEQYTAATEEEQAERKIRIPAFFCFCPPSGTLIRLPVRTVHLARPLLKFY